MRATMLGLALLMLAPPVGAQRWLPADSVALVQRAITERDARDTDRLLRSWQATAHGVLRFASVIEHGGYPVERVVKIDELRVEVYGEAPNRSKQVITAWRDTTLLPNRLVYHRDHLGIVANDFGPTIRLGDGEEVRDVPHPLSHAGAGRYLFAAGDTVLIGAGAAPTRVVAVAVRPVDATAAAAVGTLYLDLDRSALVQFRFTFTAASYRDPSVEEITVSLENALQDGQRWLPWRQAIVIRRGTPWLDLPVRTVIRADWTIDDYVLGADHPPQRFAGPAIAGLRRTGGDSIWRVPLAAQLDSLPMTSDGVDAARRTAIRAIGAHLAGLPRARAAADGLSGVAGVNRVQGVWAKPGVTLRGPGDVTLQASLGVGSADRKALGALSLGWRRAPGEITLGVARTVRDVSDDAVISGSLNSLRTLASGDDRLDWYSVDKVGVSLERSGTGGGVRVEVAHESVSSVSTAFNRPNGMPRVNPELGAATYAILRGSFSRRSMAGIGLVGRAEFASGSADWARIDLSAEASHALGSGTMSFRVSAGAGTRGLPAHRSFTLGGRSTLPAVGHRTMGGQRFGLAEAAWTRPLAVPTPPLPLVRRVGLPTSAGLFVAAGVTGGMIDGVPWTTRLGVQPVAGIRLDLWGPLLRIDAAVALRTGAFTVVADVHPDWWPIL